MLVTIAAVIRSGWLNNKTKSQNRYFLKFRISLFWMKLMKLKVLRLRFMQRYISNIIDSNTAQPQASFPLAVSEIVPWFAHSLYRVYHR